MWSSETRRTFPLSSVKPLNSIFAYRDFCLEATKTTLKKGSVRRAASPLTGARLESFGEVDGLTYLRCPDTHSLFLADVASAEHWADLLKKTNDFRRSPRGFHSDIAESRAENVYRPKLDWIQSTLVLQQIHRPSLLEVTTTPSEFLPMIAGSGIFREQVSIDEAEFANGKGRGPQAEVIVMPESLDRVQDPKALLQSASDCLASGGLIFVTGLVCSGFDLAVLGTHNVYLYPPDRTNCFSLRGLQMLFTQAGFELLEVSTPGVLDVEIVRAHVERDGRIPLSRFERELLASDGQVHSAFQTFLQQNGMSSFARIVGRKKTA